MEEYFQIGVIANTHGVRGEVKVLPTTDDPKRFELLTNVWMFRNQSLYKELEIEKVRYFKQFVLLKFKGYDNLNDVEPFKKSSLQIPKSLLLPLEEDEYYMNDLIGLDVLIDENGEKIGKLKDILVTGSNDVYVVERHDDKELLLPAIKECIKSIDLENGKIFVHLLKGLVD